jgi:DNA-binding response OmpR family regulator
MSKKRILLVDDEPDFVETVEFFLSGSDYQVFVAKNGKQALEQVKMNKPDLVLLDVMMPEMDGLEACKRLKKDSTTNSIPIIMLTAKGRKEDVVDAIAAGADSYVVKPFNLSDLVERIEEILDDSHSH